MKPAALLFLITVLLLTPGGCLAQKTRYAADPTLLGAGARSLGMGSAFVALSNDATALYWNPAGLAMPTPREMQLQHAEQFGGSVNHDLLMFKQPLTKGGLGFGLTRLGVDNIALTTLEDPTQPLGPNNRPIITQTVGTTDYTFQLAYARTIRNSLHLGTTLKLVRRNLAVGTGSGFGIDLGILYVPSPALHLGAVIRNATRTKLAYDSGNKDTLSPSLLMGLAYTFPFAKRKDTITGSVSVHVGEEKSSLETMQGIQAGIEYLLKQKVAFRGGVQNSHLTLGTGLKTTRFALDLAFTEHNQLDNTYRISASIYF